MHLHYTSAPSSRITKPRKRNPLLRPRPRSTPSPFSTHPRRKPTTTPPSPTKPSSPPSPSTNDPPSTELLPFLTPSSFPTIPTALTHALSTKFTPLPPRNAGLSSVRIAHILNFRAALPPLMTLPHLHALLGAPTRTERLLAECVREGKVRKLAVQTRAVAAPGGVLEGVVLFESLEGLVRGCTALEEVEGLIDKFLALLRQNPASPTLSRSQFTPTETHALLHSGFLVRAPAFLSSTHISNTSFPTTSSTSTTELTSAISLARVGIHKNNNNTDNTALPPSRQRQGQQRQKETETETEMEKDPLSLSLPSLGPYLKHLSASKSHLFSLLSQTRTKELPLSLLRERWDGSSSSSASRVSGGGSVDASSGGGFGVSNSGGVRTKSGDEGTTKLPAKMTKWKYLHGASLEWVLAEAVGGGEVEVFDSGVGWGVRDVR